MNKKNKTYIILTKIERGELADERVFLLENSVRKEWINGSFQKISKQWIRVFSEECQIASVFISTDDYTVKVIGNKYYVLKDAQNQTVKGDYYNLRDSKSAEQFRRKINI